jgi:outer membrane biogenesis lipoprotein LolB
MRRGAPALLFLSVWALVSCHPPRPAVSPPPPVVESVEGYAAFRLAKNGGTAKSKLSFLFRLPGQGRIEVIDPLGRTASVLFLDAEEAYLVLPSKRAYWKAGREEVMSRLLGFAVGTEDMVHILTGRADRLTGWTLEKDGQGRVVRGGRDDLRFEIRQFFEQSPLPRLVVFIRAEDRGSLRVLKMSFNQPMKADAFHHFFLEEGGYRPADWPEIENWLREKAAK